MLYARTPGWRKGAAITEIKIGAQTKKEKTIKDIMHIKVCFTDIVLLTVLSCSNNSLGINDPCLNEMI